MICVVLTKIVLFQLKFIPRRYMEQQNEITQDMRAVLVDWLVEVQESFELNHETLYSAVRLVDLYLSRSTVNKENLQLVGTTAMLISSKFEVSTKLVADFWFVNLSYLAIRNAALHVSTTSCTFATMPTHDGISSRWKWAFWKQSTLTSACPYPTVSFADTLG